MPLSTRAARSLQIIISSHTIIPDWQNDESLGSQLSNKRPLKGGSPQGSIMGCYLYCAATRKIDLSLPKPDAMINSPQSPGPDRAGESEDASLLRGPCSDWKVSETALTGKCQKLLRLESVRIMKGEYWALLLLI